MQFTKVSYYTSFQDVKVSGASTSYIVRLIVGIQKVRRSAVAQWHNVHSKSAESHSVDANMDMDRRTHSVVLSEA